MKMFLLVASLFLTVSCATQELRGTPEAPAVVGDSTLRASDTLYRCTYKYDSKYNIAFLGSKRVEFHPPSLPNLLVYHIVDTNGVKWSVNEYDWNNYTCIPTITKG